LAAGLLSLPAAPDNAEYVGWGEPDEWRPTSRELRSILLADLADAGGTVLVRSGSRYGYAARALRMRGVVTITGDEGDKHTLLTVTLAGTA
jgi:hypothetical protein